METFTSSIHTKEKMMAIVQASYNLPTSNLEAYGKWATANIENVILKAPGLRSFQGFRNLLLNSPEVLLIYDFDSMENALQFVRSAAFAKMSAEAKSLGATDLNTQLWDVSPLTPEPLRP
jgi:quinol monooxygenase YgiN